MSTYQICKINDTLVYQREWTQKTFCLLYPCTFSAWLTARKQEKTYISVYSGIQHFGASIHLQNVKQLVYCQISFIRQTQEKCPLENSIIQFATGNRSQINRLREDLSYKTDFLYRRLLSSGTTEILKFQTGGVDYHTSRRHFGPSLIVLAGKEGTVPISYEYVYVGIVHFTESWSWTLYGYCNMRNLHGAYYDKSHKYIIVAPKFPWLRHARLIPTRSGMESFTDLW